MKLRELSKRGLERVLRSAFGDPRRMRGRTMVLAYHNVVPDRSAGKGDRSLHLAQGDFLRQLDLIERHCRVVPLDTVLGQDPAPEALQAAITFDDAYQGAVESALPELSRRGMPVTLFVAPGLLGSRSFWWDDLAAGTRGLPPDRRRAALEDLAGRHDLIRARFPSAGPEAAGLPPEYGCVSEAQLAAVASLPGVSLGSHSWSHPNLARASAEELTRELQRPREWLQARGGTARPFIAYPYGSSSAAVMSAARTAGYSAGFMVHGGWLPQGTTDPMALPRFNVPAGLSADGLLLRLAGVLAA